MTPSIKVTWMLIRYRYRTVVARPKDKARKKPSSRRIISPRVNQQTIAMVVRNNQLASNL